MAEYTLTLDNLKFANVTNFSRNFGTKKIKEVNGGSLTTEEFNIANALPFDTQRPLIITESSHVSEIQYDAKILVNGSGLTVILGTATEGIKVTVATLFDTTVTYNTDKTYLLKSGDIITLMYFNSQWNIQSRAIDTVPTVDSSNLITSGAVDKALTDLTEYKTLVERVIWTENKPAICTEGIIVPENAKEICIVGGFPNGSTAVNQYPIIALYNLIYDTFSLVSGGSRTTFFTFGFQPATRTLILESLTYNGEEGGLDYSSFNKMIYVSYR